MPHADDDETFTASQPRRAAAISRRAPMLYFTRVYDAACFARARFRSVTSAPLMRSAAHGNAAFTQHIEASQPQMLRR